MSIACEDDGVEAAVLVDASNAFINLNREAALRNNTTFAQLSQSLLPIPTEKQALYLSTSRPSTRRRAQRRETLSQWLFMQLLYAH